MLYGRQGGNIVTKAKEKAKVLKAFFASQKVSPQQLAPWARGDMEQNRSPVVQEKVVSGLLCHLDSLWSQMWFTHRTVRELMEELTKLLPTIYHQSWLTGEVPED